MQLDENNNLELNLFFKFISIPLCGLIFFHSYSKKVGHFDLFWPIFLWCNHYYENWDCGWLGLFLFWVQWLPPWKHLRRQWQCLLRQLLLVDIGKAIATVWKRVLRQLLGLFPGVRTIVPCIIIYHTSCPHSTAPKHDSFAWDYQVTLWGTVETVNKL